MLSIIGKEFSGIFHGTVEIKHSPGGSILISSEYFAFNLRNDQYLECETKEAK